MRSLKAYQQCAAKKDNIFSKQCCGRSEIETVVHRIRKALVHRA